MTRNAPSTSIIVVTFNGRDLIGPCLDSILAQTWPPTEIIVVDNGSSDETVGYLRREYPSVRIVELPSNRGFAGGANAGIREASGDLIAFLNSDALADQLWLAELVRLAQSGPDVGMVASKMLFLADPSTINSAGISLDRAVVARYRWRGTPASIAQPASETFGACAGAALYRPELFADIGTFAQDFFM